MIGGVLVQRTVGEILPALDNSVQQMSLLITTLEKQVEEKGKELVSFREKFNIRLQNDGSSEPQSDTSKSQEEGKSAGVLVNS